MSHFRILYFFHEQKRMHPLLMSTAATLELTPRAFPVYNWLNEPVLEIFQNSNFHFVWWKFQKVFIGKNHSVINSYREWGRRVLHSVKGHEINKLWKIEYRKWNHEKRWEKFGKLFPIKLLEIKIHFNKFSTKLFIKLIFFHFVYFIPLRFCMKAPISVMISQCRVHYTTSF